MTHQPERGLYKRERLKGNLSLPTVAASALTPMQHV
jgi:hypothetical protein